MLAAIRVYKTTVSPLIPMCCRYLPTCADYTAEAIQTHGALRGGWIGFKRICRCHPMGGRGYDPVPPCTRVPAAKGSPSGLTTRHS
jgi:hypothetical protein